VVSRLGFSSAEAHRDLRVLTQTELDCAPVEVQRGIRRQREKMPDLLGEEGIDSIQS